MDDVRLDTAVMIALRRPNGIRGARRSASARSSSTATMTATVSSTRPHFMIVLCGIGLGCWCSPGPTSRSDRARLVGDGVLSISPTVLANTSLVTTDAGITCFIFGTVYFLWRTTQRYSAANVAGLIAFFVLAIVTKFSRRHPRTADCRAARGGRPRWHLHHSASHRRADAGDGGCRGAGDLGHLRFSIRADPIGRLGSESRERAARADGSRTRAPDRVDRSPPSVAEHVHGRIPDVRAIDDDHE